MHFLILLEYCAFTYHIDNLFFVIFSSDYYIRSGLFERARDTYEESIQTVTTVRDFTHVFDAYAQFEELSLAKRMEEFGDAELSKEESLTLDLYMARFEDLIGKKEWLIRIYV